eukprot:gene12539-biopygen16944
MCPGRNGSGRVPDASHTIEVKETDASRTRERALMDRSQLAFAALQRGGGGTTTSPLGQVTCTTQHNRNSTGAPAARSRTDSQSKSAGRTGAGSLPRRTHPASSAPAQGSHIFWCCRQQNPPPPPSLPAAPENVGTCGIP